MLSSCFNFFLRNGVHTELCNAWCLFFVDRVIYVDSARWLSPLMSSVLGGQLAGNETNIAKGAHIEEVGIDL